MLPLRFSGRGPRDSVCRVGPGAPPGALRNRVPVGASGALLTGMNLRCYSGTVKENLPGVGRLNEKRFEGRLTVTGVTGCGALDYHRPHRLHGPPALCVSRWPCPLVGSPGPVETDA